ncbi:hypothetical protein TNCV_3105501 [Trichonephila clavipes]|nr:hypothetical protein TNCV_3105501 [Trichonephila clavipes]
MIQKRQFSLCTQILLLSHLTFLIVRNCYRVCLSTLSIQWIPGHCGVTGNEFADHPAKKGASIQQITTKAVPFTSAKRIIKVPDYFRNRDFTNAYKWGSCGSPVVKVSDDGRHVMSSSPVPIKTRRVGERCKLNLSRGPSVGVVVMRGSASLGVVLVT